jgi:glycosyltransferase involved in cell wall biosynthesis
MRILIVPSWYPTSRHPLSGIFVREQADALHSMHEVRVLYPNVLPRSARQRARRVVTRERGYVEEILDIPNRPLVWQFIYLRYLFRALRRIEREFGPDVVHCHVAVPAGWATALLRRAFHAPLILTEHSSEFGSWMRRPGLRWMARRAAAGVDLILCVSEGQRVLLKQTFPHSAPVAVVPNMVNTDRFMATPLPPTDRGFRALFVGLLETPQKGAPVLLQALASIRRSSSIRLHLDLVGDGALRGEYESQARQLGLESIVTFHGAQPNDVVARLLQQSHALVLPSLHEALPVTIIEALASGRPVISTRCGGPEYLIDANNGRIVEPGQVEPLAEAIVDVLAHLDRYDPAQIAAIGAARYGRRAVTTTITKIYEELSAGTRPRRVAAP